MLLQIKSAQQIRLYIIIISSILLLAIMLYIFKKPFRLLIKRYIKKNFFFLTTFFSFYVIYLISRLFFPKTVFLILFKEDGVFEYLTTIFFLLAFVFFLLSLSKQKRKFINFYILILSLVCFFVGMEEISWGQRIFGVETPETIKKINYQDELTVHNLVAPDYHPQIYLVISILCLIFFSFANNTKYNALFWVHKKHLPSKKFISIAFLLPFIAIYNMEHFELILSFLFCIYAFQLYLRKISKESKIIWY